MVNIAHAHGEDLSMTMGMGELSVEVIMIR
jgi:hypothetical protein